MSANLVAPVDGTDSPRAYQVNESIQGPLVIISISAALALQDLELGAIDVKSARMLEARLQGIEIALRMARDRVAKACALRLVKD